MKAFLWLKNRNRTMLELRTGIVILGLLMCGIGLFFVTDKGRFAGGVWFGVFGALAVTAHMYICLDKALDFDEKTASKKIYSGYLVRYFVIVTVFVAICITDVFDPLVVFFSYMTLKVAALLQPFTHKFYNFIFSEKDPIPMSLEELEALEAQSGAETANGTAGLKVSEAPEQAEELEPTDEKKK